MNGGAQCVLRGSVNEEAPRRGGGHEHSRSQGVALEEGCA